jgi:FAD dependent monooxygenase
MLQVLYPGVARVFDQFGILRGIQDSATPIRKESLRWPDGRVLAHSKRLSALSEAFDSPPIFFERQKCVTVLYNGLPDKSKVRTGARVERFEHTEFSVKVFLADGTYEEGDIVIGADGVHSLTRQLMWDYAAKNEPGAVPESDKTAIFSQYKGVFGVTDQGDLPDLGDADTHVVLGDGSTKLLFTQPGIAYWGITFKDEYSCPPKPYRPTLDEQEQVGERFKDVKMTENLTFGDLWKNKSRSAALNIEEGILDKWHAGRIVLVGDSAHKVRQHRIIINPKD